jgi:uncharacterized protein YutE (UPF0331/DUF86 family)
VFDWKLRSRVGTTTSGHTGSYFAGRLALLPNVWVGPIVVDPDVIARRLLALSETLQYLDARLPEITAERLAADPLLQAGVERWLQVAIESCIDIAYHVVAERGWTPPETARGAFETLAVNGLLSRELAERLSRAAGMRNILVHDYIRVDRAILASAVRTRGHPSAAAGLDGS